MPGQTLDGGRIEISPGRIAIRRMKPEWKVALSFIILLLINKLYALALLLLLVFDRYFRVDVEIDNSRKHVLCRRRFMGYRAYRLFQVDDVVRTTAGGGRYCYVLRVSVSKGITKEIALTPPLSVERPEPAYVTPMLREIREILSGRDARESLPHSGK